MSRKPADARKAEIVTAMLRLADEVGPDRLTTQSVADAVGVTQPAIFRHFATKRELWLAVAAMISDSLRGAWVAALKTPVDPAQRIEALILAQLRQIELMPAIPSILFSRELQVENDGLRQSVLSIMTEFTGLLSQEVTKGQTSGLFHSDIATKDAVVLLLSLMQSLALRWTLGQRGFDLLPEARRLIDVQLRLLHIAQPKVLS